MSSVDNITETLTKISKKVTNFIKTNPIKATAISCSIITSLIIRNIKYSKPFFSTSKNLFKLSSSPKPRTGGSISPPNTNNPHLTKLQSILSEYITNGEDIATQLCIYIKNEEILNIYACDDNNSLYNEYNESSMHTYFSLTKNITTLLMAIAVNNNWIKYNDYIIKYWKYFPVNMYKYTKNDLKLGKIEYNVGKLVDNSKFLTISDVLRHESGLDTLFVNDDDLISFKKTTHDNIREIIEKHGLCYKMFDEKDVPEFLRGKCDTNRFYHGMTRGFILNEIFRNVEPKGRYMNEYFKQEILPVLSKDDNKFKLFLKGVPPNILKNEKVYHIKEQNKFWFIYHMIIPIIFSTTILLPNIKNTYFSKHIQCFYSDFNKLKQTGSMRTMVNMLTPEWDKLTEKNSKLFENENKVAMEFMSMGGIGNSHSLTKLVSHFTSGAGGNVLNDESLTEKQEKFDGFVLALTNMTKGGYGYTKLYDIEWYGWSGMGGHLCLYSPKYQCVFTYLVTGNETFNYNVVPGTNMFAKRPRTKVLLKYISQYLKSLDV